MEMLNRPHTLQVSPIPKPDNILLPTNPRESLTHKPFNLGSTRRQQVIRTRIRRKSEFRPDDEMDDAGIEAVGPVVAEDFVGFFQCRSSQFSSRGSGDFGLRGKEDLFLLEKWEYTPFLPNLAPSTTPDLHSASPPHPNLSARINRIILPCCFTILSVHRRYCRSSLGTRVNWSKRLADMRERTSGHVLRVKRASGVLRLASSFGWWVA